MPAKAFNLNLFPYINEQTSRTLRDYFGKDKDDYAGKKAHDLLNQYAESAHDQKLSLSEETKQDLINSLRLVISYANSFNRDYDKIQEMMDTPGVGRRGAEILYDAGYTNKEDFTKLIKGQLGTHRFEKGERVDIIIDNIPSSDIIIDMPTEATRMYDDVIRKVDMGPGEAEMVWNSILALLASKNIHAGPGPSLVRPP